MYRKPPSTCFNPRPHTRNNDRVRVLERLVHALPAVPRHQGPGVDVGQICCDSGRVDDVKQSQVCDEVRLLQKQR